MKTVKVLGVSTLKEAQDTYDITIKDNHNYFVSTGGYPILVHNCKDKILDYVIGPIRHTVDIPILCPKVIIHRSKLNRKIESKQWMTMMRHLYSDEKRNMGIVQLAIKLLRKNKKNSIVVPVATRGYAEALVEEINIAWMNKTGSTEQIAAPFYRMKTDIREQVLTDARNRKIRVIVAMRSMLLGINVPVWSHMIECTPINNEPNFEQETMRICTPLKGKKPEIHFVVDMKCKPVVKCFLASIQHCKNLGYEIDSKQRKKIANIRQDFNGRQHGDGIGMSSIGKPGQKITL